MQILPIIQYYQLIIKYKIKKYAFMHFGLICLFVYLFICLFVPPVRAEGISLGISSSLLRLSVDPGSDDKRPIILENKGVEDLQVELKLKPFVPSGEKGKIRYLNENEINPRFKEFLNNIHLTDNGIAIEHFELGPKQKKNFEIQFSIPAGEQPADYHISLLFLASLNESGDSPANQIRQLSQSDQADNSQYKTYSIVKAGISENILLSVGKTNPSGSVEEFSAPSFMKSGPVNFTVRVRNTGRQIIRPRGIIFIKNMFGQTVGRMDLEQTNILDNSVREIFEINGNYKQIVWPEKFLLGPYSATLNLAISEKGPIYNKTIFFYAFPVEFLVGFIVFLIIGVAVAIRIIYHLKHDK